MLQNGYLVLYKNNPALITETGTKYTIRFQNGTQSVREKDISLLCTKITNTLPLSNSEKKETFFNQLQEIWEILCTEDNKPYNIIELLELIQSEYTPDDVWNFYECLIESPFFQIQPVQNPHFPYFIVHTQEEIEKIKEKENAKKQEEELKKAFFKRLKARSLKLPEDGIFMSEIEAYVLGKTDKCRILQEAHMNMSQEKAHQLLLDTEIWQLTRNPHPSRFGLSTQSAQLSLPSPPEEQRTVLTHTAYAIDNSFSNDPDDAISFCDGKLWIHIADPAATVTPDSDIDKQARNRGATLYLPEGAVRMLSETSLSEYALGLQEEETPPKKSRALSFCLTLNDENAIIDIEILKTLIKVERLTYDQASNLEHSDKLAPLFAIAKKNIERRKKAGAVFITVPEAHISVTEGIPTIEKHERTLGARLVQECMLLAGEGVARFAFKNNIPFPFISQSVSPIPSDIPEGLAGEFMKRRYMSARRVSLTPGIHAGLGLGMYTQITSPLRRYGDLLAHQQLRAFIDNQPLIDKDELLNRMSAGDAASSATVRAERKSRVHWTLVYFLQHPELIFDAVVINVKENIADIFIPDVAYESSLHVQNSVALNTIIKIAVDVVDIPTLNVTFKEI